MSILIFVRCFGVIFNTIDFKPPFRFSDSKKAAGMNLRLNLVRYFVLEEVFRIPSVYLMGETAEKGKV